MSYLCAPSCLFPVLYDFYSLSLPVIDSCVLMYINFDNQRTICERVSLKQLKLCLQFFFNFSRTWFQVLLVTFSVMNVIHACAYKSFVCIYFVQTAFKCATNKKPDLNSLNLLSFLLYLKTKKYYIIFQINIQNMVHARIL